MAVKTLVGMLFIVGFLLLGGLTFMVEDLNELFEEGYILKVRLKEAPLEKGDPVTLAGKKIGKVKTINIDEKAEMPVEVVARIDQGTSIYDTYVAKVMLSSLIGKPELAIDIHYEPGKSKLLGDGDEMPLTEDTVSLDSVLVKAKQVAEDVSQMTAKIRSGEGTVGKLIMEDDAYNDLRAGLSEIKAGVEPFRTTFEKADKIVARVEDVEHPGMASRIVNDEALSADVKDAITEVRSTFTNTNKVLEDARAGKGTVGKLLSDEEMAADARDMVANAKKAFGGIEAVTSDIKAGKGTLGRLASDEQLANNVDQAVTGFKKTGQNLADITDKVKKGEGSVGKLMSDDKLIKTAQNILDSVQAALEDLRESAPVASFAGAILGAF